MRERFQGTRKLSSVLGEKLLVADSLTNEPVLSASYRIVGWVEEAQAQCITAHTTTSILPLGRNTKLSEGPHCVAS